MTTTFDRTETCALCGATGIFKSIMSTSSFGRDLDMRPCGPQRTTLPLWVRRCASCDYCAPLLSKADERAGSLVSSEDYKRLARDASLPELASRFLCWSLLQRRCTEIAGAGWSAVFAAWACDDTGSDAGAGLCRRQAIDLFKSTRDEGGSFADGAGVEEAVLADLYRRVGDLEDARAACRDGMEKQPDDTTRKVLEFQLRLVGSGDRASHKLDEALKASS